MKEFLKQFFYLLDPQAKKAVPFLIAVFLISSVLDVVGIGLIGVFLGLLTNPQYLLEKLKYIHISPTGFSEQKLVFYSGLLIIVAFVTKAVLSLLIQSKIVFFCQSMSIRLKTRIMTAYQYAPYTYHLKRNSAHLLSRVQENTNSFISNTLMAVVTLVSNVIVTFMILFFLLCVHPFLTVFLIIMFASLGLGYDYFTKHSLTTMGRTVAVINGEIIKNVHQGLHGLNEVRVLGKENYFLDRLTQLSTQFAHAYGTLTVLQLGPRYLIENAIAIFIVGLSLIGLAAGSDMASIVAMVGMFGAAGARLLPTVNQIISSINQIRGYSHHMHLIYIELTELDQLVGLVLKAKSALAEGKLNFSEIRLEKVCYQYPETTHAALENVDMTIYKGQSIGLIGPSGAGKSSLVNLILGFLEPQQGQMRVDGKHIDDLRAWLNNFAYIPQSIFLLDDTLRRNVALGVEDHEIDEKRVLNSINMAQLSEVVNHLPNGLDTAIGEAGIRLSGGQRQRVALARAFYHERDVIIMDEATSSLDNETEKEVINTIKLLKGNKTLIVIAHRLSTVEHCDVLYRLDHGRVSAVGSFQEVIGVV